MEREAPASAHTADVLGNAAGAREVAPQVKRVPGTTRYSGPSTRPSGTENVPFRLITSCRRMRNIGAEQIEWPDHGHSDPASVAGQFADDRGLELTLALRRGTPPRDVPADRDRARDDQRRGGDHEVRGLGRRAAARRHRRPARDDQSPRDAQQAVGDTSSGSAASWLVRLPSPRASGW